MEENANKLHFMASNFVIHLQIFTARAYARAVLGVVILSVRLSHAWIVTKLNDALQIFLYHTKGQSLCYSDTKSGWWATPPSLSAIAELLIVIFLMLKIASSCLY